MRGPLPRPPADRARGHGWGQRIADDAHRAERRPLEANSIRRLRPEHLRIAGDGPAETVARGRRAAQDEFVDGQERVVEEWIGSRRTSATAISWFVPKNCSSASLGTSLYDAMIVERFFQAMPSSEA